jgi:hypothetical protein
MLGTRPFPNVIGSRRSGGALLTLYFHETEDTDWDNGANWYEEITGNIQWNLVPTAAQHAIIQNGTCNADGTCASLVVAGFGTLASNNGTVITNNGTVNINNGTVTTNNGFVSTNASGATVTNNNGTVTTNNGTVNTNASGATITDHNSGATVGLNNGTIVNALNGSIITDEGTGTITNDNR